MNWGLVRKTTRTPFFHYAPYVVIGVPLLAELFVLLRPYITSLRFPHLLALGFGAGVLFIFSEVIYHFFCPEIVQHYETEKAYVEAHAAEYEASQNHQRINVVLPNLEPSEDDVRDRLKQLLTQRRQTELDKELDVLYPIAVRRFLRNEYRRKAYSRTGMAWLAFSLYMFGVALASYVMYGRVMAVVEALERR